MRNPQTQAANHEYIEHSRDSLKLQQMVSRRNTGTRLTKNLQKQDHNEDSHSEFVEPLWDSLRTAGQKGDGLVLSENNQGYMSGVHSEFVEPS